MQFQDLTMAARELFDSHLRPYPFATHEYCFTNLYLWKKYCRIQYAVIDRTLILKKRDYLEDDFFFMQPLGYRREDLPHLIEVLAEYADRHGHTALFRYAEQPFVGLLTELYPDRFLISSDPDSSDYLYETDTFLQLPGDHFRAQKNHIRHFLKHNRFTLVPLTADRIGECLRFAEQWCQARQASGSLLAESRSLGDLLAHMEELRFVGMLIFLDEKLSAFILGERLNDSTCVIHVEKADSRIKGLYNFLKQSFVERYFADTRYVNWEQDLGIEGLRQAKMSYKPCRLEKKYSILEKKR